MIETDPRAVERIEARRFVTGAGIYVDDIQLDGMLHAVILRSQIAHGTIRSVDVAAARALPGVHAVFTAADFGPDIPALPLRLAPIPGVERFMQIPIAAGKVRYVGEPLAVVVAQSRHIAEDALDLIEPDIEPLPVIADIAASHADEVLLHEAHGTNIATRYRVGKGDADAAFARADRIVRAKLRSNRQTASPMETRGLIADWNAALGRLTIHGAAKVPHTARKVLASMLGLETAAIEMIEYDIGGGFGVRGEFHPEDYLIPFAARALARPVKWIEDRREHLSSANHSREMECELELACAKDGTFLGLRARLSADMGAAIRPNSGVVPAKAAQFLPDRLGLSH